MAASISRLAEVPEPHHLAVPGREHHHPAMVVTFPVATTVPALLPSTTTRSPDAVNATSRNASVRAWAAIISNDRQLPPTVALNFAD